MTKSAIHTFVYKGRNYIKVKLGFPSSTIKSIPVDIDLLIENSSSDTNCSSDEDFPTKSFVFTFSVDEWNQIKPQEVLYRLNDKNRPLKTCAALIRTPSNINVLSSPSVELNQVDYGNEHLSSSFNCTEQNQWPDKTLNIIENNNNDDEWSSLRFIEDNQKSPSALYVVTDTEVLINKESDYIQENEDCENPCINDLETLTYSERVDIIMNHMNPQLQPIEYDTILAACDATIVTVINALLKDFPTLKLSTICSSSCFSPIFPLSKVHLSYQTTDGKIRKLQEFLDNCITPEKSKCEYMLSEKLCEGIKEVIPNISELHLFIDIFF
ncbi:hypothetical protein ACI65C_013589 [Semiaphis heraclei]